MCSHMTSHGSPYARFQRALRIGKLSMALALVDRHPPVAKDTLKEFLRSDKPSTELAAMLRREMGTK